MDVPPWHQTVKPCAAGCADEEEFQQFVVAHIQKLLSGQERIERLLAAPCDGRNGHPDFDYGGIDGEIKIEAEVLHNYEVDHVDVTPAKSMAATNHGVSIAEAEVEMQASHRRRGQPVEVTHSTSVPVTEIVDHPSGHSIEFPTFRHEDTEYANHPAFKRMNIRWLPPNLMSDSTYSEQLTSSSSNDSWFGDAKWPVTLKPGWPRTLKLRHQGERQIDTDEEAQEIETSMVAARRTVEMKMLGPHSTQRLSKTLAGIDQNGQRLSRTLANMLRGSANTWTLTITPYHPLRLIFDLISMVFLCYDLVTIPIFLAWDIEIEASGNLRNIQAAVTFYWTIDMFASFFTGYISDGEVVTDNKKVAMRYLKGSFAIDFAVLIVDWLSLWFMSTTTTRAIRMTKVGRLFRIVDVFRMAKVADALHRLADRYNARSVALGFDIFNILKLLLLVIYINHILACVWFATAKYAYSDTGTRWTDLLIAEGDERYEDTNNLYLYTSSLHWSLTQMTPGSMQINAQNSPERLLNICCLLFGVLFFGTLISKLSAKLVELTMLTQRKTAQINSMQKFFRERQVDSSLALVVKQQVRERMDARKPLIIQNVEAFTFVSEKLRHELHMSISRPFLLDHPLFVVILRLNREHAKEICFHAMSFCLLNRGDILFSAGGDCYVANVICEGSLTYTQKPETSWVFETHTCSVSAGIWLSEAALWSEWTHLGTAESSEAVEILKIDAEQLLSTAKKHLLIKRLLLDFGKAYYNRVVTIPRMALLTDLCDSAIQRYQLIAGARGDVKTLVSMVSIEILAESRNWFQAVKWQRLYRECIHGETILVPISSKTVHRCVDVACLKLIRRDGSIFVMVGLWDEIENKIMPADIKLPGTKLTYYEDRETALVRVLEYLGSLKDHFFLTRCEDKHQVQKSHKYGVTTTYNRYIFEAVLDPTADLPSWLTNSQPLTAGETLPAKAAEKNFYITENDKAKQVVYAWISPGLFDQVTSGTGHVDFDVLLRGFDRKDAIELESPVFVREESSAVSCAPSDEALVRLPNLPLKPRLTPDSATRHDVE